MTTDLELTEDELNVVRRFVSMLNDEGVQAVLTLRVADRYGASEVPAKALGVAIEDLGDICEYSESDGVVRAPQDIYQAAPSLALVVTFVKAPPSSNSLVQFPEDFVPSDELVRKCLHQYFAEGRKSIAESLTEESDEG